jgi:predicted nucleotide-binding protein (sugar kinase/HSP70/actin superfamily)
VEYVEHGFDGIISLMPFGCMPGTIVSALLYQFRDIYDGIPVFNLVLDSQKDPGQEMRLEAFYHQCNEHMRKREKQGKR